MNEKNDFERQVEMDEQAQTEYEPAEETASGSESGEILKKVRELVKKGNVSKIVIKRGEETLVNIPVNVGIVGGIIGIAAAPWAIIAAAVATAGFACQVEIVKADGEVVRVTGKTVAEKARNVGAAVADKGSSAIHGLKDVVDSFRGEAEDAEIEIPDIEVEIEDNFDFDPGTKNTEE